ncbi:unnamed protein product [Clavelina lepadiformis]|uniref:Uncharacterized protein n=1 Tax=Clavelina lepadiformis TaxID=159417 RepID=A0ABP0G311_CLALP
MMTKGTRLGIRDEDKSTRASRFRGEDEFGGGGCGPRSVCQGFSGISGGRAIAETAILLKSEILEISFITFIVESRSTSTNRFVIKEREIGAGSSNLQKLLYKDGKSTVSSPVTASRWEISTKVGRFSQFSDLET